MQHLIKTITLSALLSLTSPLMASEHNYIDGPKVEGYILTLCNTLDGLYKNSTSSFIKKQVKANIYNTCGFRYVKPLNWYITNGKYIPRFYGNIFSSASVKRKYQDLMTGPRTR